MSGGACLSDTHQRARGDLLVSAKRRGAESVLDGLRQAGCLKARFSRPVSPGWLDATMINTSGGVAGGDRLDIAITAGDGTRVTVAAQAAERFYRALPETGASLVRNTVTVGAGAALEWLPQETILFDRCALDRRLTVDVAPDASFLGVETLVFGRAAMGEILTSASLRDLFEMRRGGERLLHDAIRMEGDVSALLARKAVADGARVLTTLVYAAPDAEVWLEPARAAADCAISAWNGMLIARSLAPDTLVSRAVTTALLSVLRGGRPLPRVWMC